MTTNNIPTPLLSENIWHDAGLYIEAETHYQEFCARKPQIDSPVKKMKSSYSLVDEIALARQRIQNTLKDMDSKDHSSSWIKRIVDLESDNINLVQKIDTLTAKLADFSDRVTMIEAMHQKCHDCTQKQVTSGASNRITNGPAKKVNVSQVKNARAENVVEEDDDIDLFGSDEENEEDKKIRDERVKAYEDKKAQKKQVIAKSSIVLDVKPWYDSTDMKAMEVEIRKIEHDGLKWAASQLIPVAFGIHKLQIVAIIEDEKVSVDWIQETIQDEIEEFVQSVDIVAFNKL